MNTTTVAFDPRDLEAKVKDMYRAVAEEPDGEFHFEMGRALAERLGYPGADLDRVPAEAIASFAGVGYYFHLADLRPGETVVDLGSGSGMDTFVAALRVGGGGKVVGIDMTDAQRLKAERLRVASGVANIRYLKGYIEAVPLPDASADVVISNGVINLAPEGESVPRCGAPAETRRATGDFGHRHRSATAAKHRLQCDALGGLHWRRGTARQLSQTDRDSRPQGCRRGRQPGVSVRFGQCTGRQPEIRREERVDSGVEALSVRQDRVGIPFRQSNAKGKYMKWLSAAATLSGMATAGLGRLGFRDLLSADRDRNRGGAHGGPEHPGGIFPRQRPLAVRGRSSLTRSGRLADPQ